MPEIHTFANERNYTVIAGLGAIERLDDTLTELGVTRPLLVSPRSLTDSALANGVVTRCGDRAVTRFHGARAHGPLSSVRDGFAALREDDCDGIISLGGSSAVDVAKGIAMLAAYGDLEPLRGAAVREDGRLTITHSNLGAALLPLVAIPTTLSGAEFTYQAGLTDEEAGSKAQYYDRGALPRRIFLDAMATVETPESLWLTTGVKAIDHDVERMYSRNHQPLSDALALESLVTLFKDLPASRADPGDLGARQRLLEAAWLAQFSTKNVNVGIGHALGHQIAGLLGTAHGTIACVLLPYSIGFNAVAGEAQLLRIAARLELPPSVHSVIEAVRELVQRLAMPTRLRDIGVPQETLPLIAERAMTDTAITGNPRLVVRPLEILDEILLPAW